MANSVLSDLRFHSEKAAFDYVEKQLWPHGPACPHCGEAKRLGRLEGVRSKPSKKHPEGIKDREKTTEPELENAERPFVVASGLNLFKYTTCVGCGKPPTEITRNPNCLGPNFQFSTFEYADKHVRSGLCEDCLKWAAEHIPEGVQ